MDVLFVFMVILLFVGVYGVFTYLLCMWHWSESHFFKKISRFFKRKGGSPMNHIPEKLRQFLKRHKIYYQIVVHPQTFTSLQTAEAECVCGKNVTKVVMAKVRGKDTMLVLPSSHTVDLFKLSSVLGTQDVSIEEEREFQDLFSDCEVGAMPPFGAIYHIPCYADKSVRESSELYFNAGTHTESIKISTADFLKVMKGHVLDFAVLGQKVAA